LVIYADAWSSGECWMWGAAPAGGKLLLITDAWRPQVNGVVTAFEHMKRELEKRGFEVVVIHPGFSEPSHSRSIRRFGARYFQGDLSCAHLSARSPITFISLPKALWD
jgi:hypothetical protein